MNARRIALLAGAIVGALALVLLVLRPSPVTGQSDGIIVVDADAFFTSTVSGPSHTPDLQPRFVVWYANSIKYYNDVGPPGNLPISLTDRVVFWYAKLKPVGSIVF